MPGTEIAVSWYSWVLFATEEIGRIIEDPFHPGMCLCAPYAMSSTDVAYAATCLRSCCAMPGYRGGGPQSRFIAKEMSRE
eukprot:2983498-Rhodomonas_salina.2